MDRSVNTFMHRSVNTFMHRSVNRTMVILQQALSRMLLSSRTAQRTLDWLPVPLASLRHHAQGVISIPWPSPRFSASSSITVLSINAGTREIKNSYILQTTAVGSRHLTSSSRADMSLLFIFSSFMDHHNSKRQVKIASM